MASSATGTDTHCSEGTEDPITVLSQPLRLITSKLKTLKVSMPPTPPSEIFVDFQPIDRCLHLVPPNLNHRLNQTIQTNQPRPPVTLQQHL